MSDLQQRIEQLEREAVEKEQLAKVAVSQDAQRYYENTAAHLRKEAEQLRQRVSPPA